MSEVNIITIHFGVNHGSALQAYALCRFLNDRGYNCKVVDYVPKRYGLWYGYAKGYGKYYNKALLVAYFPIYIIKTLPNRYIFRRFLKKYVPLTKRFRSINELKHSMLGADMYIAGSDQIWNTDYNGYDEQAYFLNYIDESAKKITYAASFGKDYPLDTEEIEYFKKQIRGFQAISVREADAVKILEECGISSQEVCDPTFLLSEDEWLSITNKPVTREKYVLVYVMEATYRTLVENAFRIANKIDAKVYVINFTDINDAKIDKCFDKCSPNEFISLFSNASFVVTNSFHGSAFATIFKKPLMVNGKDKYNSRIINLLEKSGQSKRLFMKDYLLSDSDVEELIKVKSCIQNHEFIDWINKSKQFLINQLGQGECDDTNK